MQMPCQGSLGGGEPMQMPCQGSLGGEPCSEFNLRVKLQDLPCGGCPYCTRAHSNWSGFNQDVDDVVPLGHKPWGQPVSEGQDQTEEEMGPMVAEIWVSTEEAGNRRPPSPWYILSVIC